MKSYIETKDRNDHTIMIMYKTTYVCRCTTHGPGIEA